MRYGIAERSCCGHAAAAASSKLYSYLLPPPFPSDILPQSWTADHCKTLILKFTWTPNMLGTTVLVFIQQRIHLVQNNNLCMVHTQKYEVHNDTVRCTDLSHKTTCIHYNINISTTGKLHLKLGSTLQKLPRWGVNNTPFWQQSHFMQTIGL